MGAVMVVHLPKLKERRIALSAYNGTKQDRIMVQLHIYHLAQTTYSEPAEQDLEALLDAIYNLIETDVTLGGCCIGAGETSYGIDSVMNIPVSQEKPERTEQYAMVSFEADFFFIA
jgi:hypothetical protein